MSKLEWHGDKAYVTCDKCKKFVRANKLAMGSLHVCLSGEEELEIYKQRLEYGVEDGISWMVSKAPIFGAINGYVKLPSNHIWRRKSKNEKRFDGIDNIPYSLLDPHGGITYYPDEFGWMGFDTMHAGDWWPGMSQTLEFPNSHKWTQQEVVEETKRIARQVADAKHWWKRLGKRVM